MSYDVTQTTASQSATIGAFNHSANASASPGQDQQAQVVSPGNADQSGAGGQSGGAGCGGDMLKDLVKLLKDMMSLASGAMGGMGG
ncbi:hypothetical protein [Paraburkholderia aromaticivorans]|uniref:hypothetical protein n=1 Tax=Paraburkholderia aromaticivorans TaxID=2026199 RepID=UPI001455E63E|nr:hypothetical protein [Paraburkholderia aromaticivorans]